MTAHLTICFKVYTMEQAKSELCPYDNKRYLLADLDDGRPNPTTHTPTAIVIWRLRSTWWPTNQCLVRSSHLTTRKSIRPETRLRDQPP